MHVFATASLIPLPPHQFSSSPDLRQQGHLQKSIDKCKNPSQSPSSSTNEHNLMGLIYLTKTRDESRVEISPRIKDQQGPHIQWFGEGCWNSSTASGVSLSSNSDKEDERSNVPRNGSGQAHSTVKIPVRNEGGRSARLLILYSVPVVNI